jgi:CDP-6-deoxy-D-xylo-4-hexulose-3-dehydrase
VFVDVELPTFGVDVAQLDAARSERTRAIILAHTLGNPFDLDAVTRFARRHDLWLVEDCCDAVGSTYDGRLVGTFGELATVSFYPAHHITMGEGGCVLTDGPVLHRIVESFRDWGRDCWCEPGDADTCGKRFGWQLGELPCGYDHKYTYSHVGYNLKATDLQAAVGVAQLRKLPDFIASRRANYARLRERVSDLEEHFVLPEATSRSDPSWFGFPMAVRPESPFTRADVVKHLEASRIGTRPLFAGNLTRQPAYADATFRVVSDLAVSDLVMEHAFWVGVYPGLTPSAIDYIAETLRTAVGVS